MADAFEVDLEQLVSRFARDLAHEVTALILRRLGIDSSAARAVAAGRGPVAHKAPAGPRRAALPVKRRAAARRARSTSEERAAAVERVERIVKGSDGLSVGDLERQSGMPRAVVSAALKALKDQGKVFMGGTKRFARYGATQAAADKASLAARRGG